MDEKNDSILKKSIYHNYEELPLNLTVLQVADVLGISRAGAYELIHTDGFPRIKIGENRYVSPKMPFIRWTEARLIPIRRKAGG